MVRDLFGVEPDQWQAEVLQAFPHHQRIAMQACKGPGKTAVLSWMAWNFLLCHPHPKVAATSISADNLADNLWTEMAYWQGKSDLLKALFAWTKTRIFAKQHPETWWMSARTWPKSADAQQQALTLAGLHADYILFLLDESGGIPDAVMATAEAALANVVDPTRQRAQIVQAGNPTHLEGPLYRAATTSRDLWFIIEITADPDDPNRTPRVSADWARQQIKTYGRDNPWVLINVFGRFPPASINALIGVDEVRDAMKRHINEAEVASSPRIISVDVAREGDDASTIFKRQGLLTYNPLVLRNATGLEGAGAVSRIWEDWDADAAMIDNTGGFGSSWIDQLIALGRSPLAINYSANDIDRRYANIRAGMYFRGCEMIRRGAVLPDCPELLADLTQTTYTFKGDALIIEPKHHIKARLGRSPDWGDGWCGGFAFPVARRMHPMLALHRLRQTDYDPLEAA